jgi:hypothetical protein
LTGSIVSAQAFLLQLIGPGQKIAAMKTVDLKVQTTFPSGLVGFAQLVSRFMVLESHSPGFDLKGS